MDNKLIKKVKKAKRGDKEALLQLILLQKDDFYRLAYTYMGNEHDAMDAMEDMIVKIYENINKLKKEEAFYRWSKTILVNSCKSLLRKRNKLVYLEDYDPSPSKQENPYKIKDQQMELYEMLSILNENQRETLLLRYIHDLDYQSISEIMDVSVGTVKSRIFNGVKKLKETFGGDLNEKY